MLKKFHENLKKGRFAICSCTECNTVAWPPARMCSSCHSKTRLNFITNPCGKLIEFTDSHMESTRGIYGIVEISGIRIMGMIRGDPSSARIGMKIRLAGCGISKDNSAYYYFEEAAEGNT